MKRLVLCFILIAGFAYADDTTINYKGQPPPSAIAPSLPSFSQDLCVVSISGAVSSTVIGLSAGGYYVDSTCERIKLAKSLEALNLKVSAVSVLCEDERVWTAMEKSGTPCPLGGSVGDAARYAWFKLYPERFTKLYGKDFTIVVPAAPTGDK